MTRLSEQLVLMLSKTHWTPAVDEAIRENVGREWLLVGHHVGDAGRAADVEISIRNRTYKQMVFDAEMDWTELKAVDGVS